MKTERLCCFVLTVAAVSAVGTLSAQAPVLVKDINTKAVSDGSYSAEFTLVVTPSKRRTFFVAQDGKNGRELWVTEGTTQNTRMVRDILVGPDSSNPHHLTAVGPRVFFFAEDIHRNQLRQGLWTSDGSVLGTRFVSAVQGEVRTVVAFGNKLLYGVQQSGAPNPAAKLYASDGTAVGTVEVASLLHVENLTVHVDNKAYFVAAYIDTQKSFTIGLWSTNGSANGLQVVYPMVSNVPFFVFEIASAGAYLYFEHPGRGLLRVTGTRTTQLLRSMETARELTALNGKLVFAGKDTSGVGTELYESDGTTGGTRLLADLVPGAGSSIPKNLTVMGSNVYFATQQYGLWGSDGTAVGTRLVREKDDNGDGIFPPSRLFDALGVLYFRAGAGQLWRSDGSELGTRLLRDFTPAAVGILDSWGVAGRNDVIFTASDRLNGYEPWISDGTKVGTRMLKDIAGVTGATAGADISTPVDRYGEVWFGGEDAQGPKLFRSNGKPAGTVAVTGPLSARPVDLTLLGDKLFFTRSTISTGGGWRHLTVHDHARGLTTLPPKDASQLTAGRTHLYFVASHKTLGLEVWRTDGTVAGTDVIKDIHPVTGHSYPKQLTMVGDTLFFAADDGARGEELWKTDGTTIGTELVLDIELNGSSLPRELTEMDGVLYFAAKDSARGTELWRSDGSARGTRVVKDIWSGSESSWPRDLTPVVTAAGVRLFFFAEDGTNGRELWVSDGSESGTVMVKDVWAGGGDGARFQMAAAHGRVFFVAHDRTHGEELFVSDGTPGGTRLLKDIWPGLSPGIGWKAGITAVGSRWVYFRGVDPVHGSELWRTDGTPAGTQMVKDLWPGRQGSNPRDFTVSGGVLYFVADHPVYGEELWKIDLGALAFPVGRGRAFAATDPVLGGTSIIWQRGLPTNGATGLAMVGLPSRRPVQFQGHWVYYDLTLFSQPFYAFSTKGSVWQLKLPIPNDAKLLGQELLLQPAYDRNKQLYIDNAVQMKLGR